MSCTLDSHCKLALVLGADSGHPARQYLGTLRQKAAETNKVLIIYMGHFINTKVANLPALASGASASAALRSFSFIRHSRFPFKKI
jgi:hypothetical protein